MACLAWGQATIAMLIYARYALRQAPTAIS
jgi:hypothetical protein